MGSLMGKICPLLTVKNGQILPIKITELLPLFILEKIVSGILFLYHLLYLNETSRLWLSLCPSVCLSVSTISDR